MSKRKSIISFLLFLSSTNFAIAADSDGFKRPLDQIQFNSDSNQNIFEQANIKALNVYDPLESINRQIYNFNAYVDNNFLFPVVKGYRYITPDFVEHRVHNFLGNIDDFTNLFNSTLQLNTHRSLVITARLLFNSTIGLLGLWDPASLMGLPKQKEDFGQTLGFYGVPAGPYLVLPLFGPSNFRDSVGLITDFEAEGSVDFLKFASFNFDYPEFTALWLIDTRSSINFNYGQFNSPFEYEKVRYFFQEARRLQIVE
ncbi:UNVERIFIED_CONTAM: hypothetical protein GTU68_036261 [Idotea baltica]|nr:hypothetical protein [Idotea baltica]